jgi:hypothetical protein
LEVLLKEELFIKRRKLEEAGRKTGLRVRVREKTISSRVASYKKVHFWHINENGEYFLVNLQNIFINNLKKGTVLIID